MLIDLGWVNAEAGQDGILQQALDGIAPRGQEHQQRGQEQQPQQQMQTGAMREFMKHRHDDAGDEKRKGHAQQQRVQVGALGKKRRKDAVERGHDG